MARGLSVLIADDEPWARQRLEVAVSRLPEVSAVHIAADGDTALELIRGARPDVVCLDIQMPGLSGLEVARALDAAHAPALIFVTAFSDFAPNAFEVEAVDYLLKPFDFERVRTAIARAVRRIEEQAAAKRVEQLQDLLANMAVQPNPPAAPERSETSAEGAAALWARERGGRTRVSRASIEWLEAEGDYVRVHTATARHLIHATLQRLVGELGPPFLRVHKSAAVNVAKVVRIESTARGALTAVLHDGARIPVGRTYARVVRERLLASSLES
jgi:DNA-binding LytR/AlgR family response regulator